MSTYDPRDHCESKAELAREVLDREELADYYRARDERSRVAASRRKRKQAEREQARAEQRRQQEEW